MKRNNLTALAIITSLLLPNCSAYKEHFTFFNDDGTPNHTVDVSYYSLLMVGKAGRLSTETQTEEFIRSVNAHNLENKVDSDSVGSISKEVVRGLVRP